MFLYLLDYVNVDIQSFVYLYEVTQMCVNVILWKGYQVLPFIGTNLITLLLFFYSFYSSKKKYNIIYYVYNIIILYYYYIYFIIYSSM